MKCSESQCIEHDPLTTFTTDGADRRGREAVARSHSFAARFCAFLTATCLPWPAWSPAAPSSFEQTLHQVRVQMQPLDLGRAPVHSREAAAYFRRYGIEFDPDGHFFGHFESSGYRIAAQVFLPKTPRGSVFLLHGYLDHAGILRPLIGLLLDLDFAVAVHDLPGHGLSSGERASIGDFSEYASVLGDFVRICRPFLPRPYHVIGHSAGCAIAFEYLNETEESVFDKVVLLAPLVRSVHWFWSKVGHLLARPFVETIPRVFRRISSDPAYLEFVRKDPLQSRKIPLRWARALYAWNKRVQRYETTPQPALIVQGTEDNIVDWKYNIPFLQRKLGPVSVVWIPGARHQLINERSDLRAEVFSEIEDYLVGRVRRVR